MIESSWTPVALRLVGTGLACLALLLPPWGKLEGGPLAAPLAGPWRACFLLAGFAGLAVLTGQVDPEGEGTPLRIALEFGGDAALLILALLPAGRRQRGWVRAGFGPLPARAAPWLLLLLAGVMIFRIVLLTYIPCQCPALDPAALGWPRVIAFVAYGGLMAPLAEEIFYRGITLPLLVVRVGGWGAIVLGALSWAMVHGEAPIIPFIALGVGLGWLTLATGSLWASIGFHAVWNVTVLGYEVYRQVAGMKHGGSLPSFAVFLAVVAFILGWARLVDVARAEGFGIRKAQDRADPTRGTD